MLHHRFASLATNMVAETESETPHLLRQEVLSPESDSHIFAFADSATTAGFVVSGARGSEPA